MAESRFSKETPRRVSGLGWLLILGASTVLLTVRAGAAFAQESGDPNSGALTVTGGVDFLPGRPYIFRGFVQETDPKITLWPYVDLGFALASGDGAFERIGVNVGVPAPMAWFPFTGWNQSFFGDLHIQGTESVHFYTRQKMTMTRWFASAEESHHDPVWKTGQA